METLVDTYTAVRKQSVRMVVPGTSGAAVRRSRCLRVSGIVGQSIVDGPGLRMTVFTQGCPHHCPGCHNESTHAFDGGFELSVDEILSEFDDNPLLAGITLSGGEPLMQPAALLPLAEAVHARGKSVWCYTGFTFEELRSMSSSDASLAGLLEHIDVLVDGRYVSALRGLELRYRGSSNQRVLDLPRSLSSGEPEAWVPGAGLSSARSAG